MRQGRKASIAFALRVGTLRYRLGLGSCAMEELANAISNIRVDMNHLVESKHLSCHLAAVHQRNSHTVVDLKVLVGTNRIVIRSASYKTYVTAQIRGNIRNRPRKHPFSQPVMSTLKL